MDNYLNSFREMISLRGLTDHTLKNYCTYIRAYLDYLSTCLHKLPEDVSWPELRDYIKWLQNSGNLSDRTINCAISQLRFFTLYVLHKPWDDTQLPMRRFDEYLPFVPSKQEVSILIDSMPDLKQKAMVALMYSSGLRIGEVCHLRYEDIQRQNMRIHIRHGKNHSDRYAILSKRALDILTAYWFAFGKPVGWLFPKQHDSSKPIDTFYLSRHIHEVERSLGLEQRITCHSLRHAFGTHLYEDGVDLLTIKALLGHKSINSTTIYVHLASNGTSDAVSPFDLMGGGHVEIHNNSCRNRNCPNCQAVLKEIWIDARKSEVIDAPYFHVVFTVPAELNPLIYANQKLLYTLLHKCSSETLLELSSDKKYLGAAPGIIQVLHTWGQTLNFHPHIHCIITGGGLTKDYNFKMSTARFFIPVKVLGSKFRGKFLAYLESYHRQGKLFLPSSCHKLRNSHAWAEFRDSLYQKAWCPYVKETFNGFGNAIEYLGRYTHRIAITNSRIVSVTENEVSFRAKDYRSGDKILVRITPVEFIRRLMMHVLPTWFQKIRYYGFLNNRQKKKNFHIIFRIQGHRKFVSLFTNSSVAEIMKTVWKYDISLCPCCGENSMRHIGRSFALQD